MLCLKDEKATIFSKQCNRAKSILGHDLSRGAIGSCKEGGTRTIGSDDSSAEEEAFRVDDSCEGYYSKLIIYI